MPITDQDIDHGYKLFSMQTSEDWQLLESMCRLPSDTTPTFSNVRRLAEKLGCRTILLEDRYIDMDYRD